jgi:hypothetical protein
MLDVRLYLFPDILFSPAAVMASRVLAMLSDGCQKQIMRLLHQSLGG